jgi:hypothetical protein
MHVLLISIPIGTQGFHIQSQGIIGQGAEHAHLLAEINGPGGRGAPEAAADSYFTWLKGRDDLADNTASAKHGMSARILSASGPAAEKRPGVPTQQDKGQDRHRDKDAELPVQTIAKPCCGSRHPGAESEENHYHKRHGHFHQRAQHAADNP